MLQNAEWRLMSAGELICPLPGRVKASWRTSLLALFPRKTQRDIGDIGLAESYPRLPP